MALERWGETHRFATEFYLDKTNNTLIVKGLGDPFLISEEIDLIVEQIKASGIKTLNHIKADTSLFAEDIKVPGQSYSDNPYDASVSALAANFNTIQVKVTKKGILPGESQTPLTPISRQLAKNLALGVQRINLGDPQRGPKYFIELLIEKLKMAGVDISSQRAVVDSDKSPQLLFVHRNTRTLDEVIVAMLKYSNNFIANQIYLLLGADQFGGAADIQKARQAASDFIQSEFKWSDYQLFDGAGLSRKNRLSTRQLLEITQRFSKYQALMPKQNDRILAKSGTLNGVSAYAGYLYKDHAWLTFALIINQPVQYRFKEQLAEELLNYQFSAHK